MQTILFLQAADDLLVVTNPDFTAMTDAYALIKVLHMRDPGMRVHVVVNRIRYRGQEREVFERIQAVCSRFLGKELNFLGGLPDDDEVPRSVGARVPFVVGAPRSGAACALRGIKDKILDLRPGGEGEPGLRPEGYGDRLARAVRYARGKGPVAAEARTPEEALAAVEGGADIILLDNMSPAELEATVSAGKRAAREVGREVLFEASGGIRLENVLEVARTGVDRISVGAITHSALPLDLSMLVTGL